MYKQRLNVDICNLSTLCSEKNANISTENALGADKEEILDALKEWQETGNLPGMEIVTHVISACHEV